MKENKIIIKKVKKGGHGGHHGGSWKVAYADFVTAMMAFFLLLWLITMSSPEKRARISTYFQHFSLFEQSGSSFMSQSSEVFQETGHSTQRVPQDLTGKNPEQFKEDIKKSIEEKLGDIKDQILVDVFEGGVRLQLVDNEGKPMFDLSSPKPTSLALRILQVIGDNIANMPNQVAVEGHTDALAYKGMSYSNWELSTERALSARRELERFGLAPERITRVAGYADTVPLIKEDPKDPRNRRISIILLFPKGEKPPVPPITPDAVTRTP
jgi:chemotaxis protein MotB